MSIRKKPYSLLITPISGGVLASRFSVLLMISAALTLVVMDKANHPAAVKFRNSVSDVLVPVVEVVASPFDAVANAGAWMAEMANLRAENIALKNQNLQLMQWQAAAKQMRTENESLRGLLHAIPDPKYSFITARIVSDAGGIYARTALLSGGSLAGIKPGQAVTSESGLVGRIVGVAEKSSRVLLINDINSRVPVMLERNGEKSILTGNNDMLPTLSYIAPNSTVEVGDRLVTSGDGGIFPAGVPVGAVTSISSGVVQVQPYMSSDNLHYVSVIDTAQ